MISLPQHTANGKRQSSWEFLKIENEQIKTAQKIHMDKKLSETTNLCAEIMNRRRQGGTNSSMPFDVNVIINLSNNNLLNLWLVWYLSVHVLLVINE